MINFQAGERVRIVGNHPHAGCEAIVTGEFLPNILGDDLLRLIFAELEEYGTGCFAAEKNLVRIQEESSER